MKADALSHPKTIYHLIREWDQTALHHVPIQPMEKDDIHKRERLQHIQAISLLPQNSRGPAQTKAIAPSRETIQMTLSPLPQLRYHNILKSRQVQKFPPVSKTVDSICSAYKSLLSKIQEDYSKSRQLIALRGAVRRGEGPAAHRMAKRPQWVSFNHKESALQISQMATIRQIVSTLVIRRIITKYHSTDNCLISETSWGRAM